MSKLSIEYAHIYTNQRVSEEHATSIGLLEETSRTAKANNQETSLVVMVDDYSFPDPSFDYESFINWLEEQGYKPDLLFRESQLMPVCDEVLTIMENMKLKDQITDYVKTKKYPCSLFIAAWYLLRLGKLSSPIFPKELIADDLMNILPESFKPFEDKGLEIIASTPHRDAVSHIGYQFIQGRLIA